MGLVSEPTPYYLLIILVLALFKRYALYPAGLMRPHSKSSRIYEAILTVLFFVYSAYVLAYRYFGLSF